MAVSSGFPATHFDGFENLCEFVATHNANSPDKPLKDFQFEFQGKEYRGRRLITGEYLIQTDNPNFKQDKVKWIIDKSSSTFTRKLNEYMKNLLKLEEYSRKETSF